MRVFPVRFAGFALQIYELQPGTLTLTHERPGKGLREYILNDEDFDDSADVLNDSAAKKRERGLDASAVGLALRLMKNDGMLKMVFEGRNGGVAEWTFNGLEVKTGNFMTASAFTQTDIDLSRRRSCVEAIQPHLSVSAVQAMSTDSVAPQIMKHAALVLSAIASIASIETEPIQIKAERPKEVGKSDTATDIDNVKHLKRKAQMIEDIHPPPHERAKSTHASAPWPRHLYMMCYRTSPIFKGDVGNLHIDVEEGTVWFEGWYSKEHMRVHERKQIDLRDRRTRVAYYRYATRKGIDGSTHYLAISRLNTKLETVNIFIADCSAPGWKMWGTDTAPTYSQSTTTDSALLITDPTVIIDALVHCVDRTSRRQAIHDPDTAFKLSQDTVRFSAFQDERILSTQDMEKWEFTVLELKKREKARRILRVVELGTAESGNDTDPEDYV